MIESRIEVTCHMGHLPSGNPFLIAHDRSGKRPPPELVIGYLAEAADLVENSVVEEFAADLDRHLGPDGPEPATALSTREKLGEIAAVTEAWWGAVREIWRGES